MTGVTVFITLSLIGTTLTAGAVRFFKLRSPHQIFWLFKVCAPQPAAS